MVGDPVKPSQTGKTNCMKKLLLIIFTETILLVSCEKPTKCVYEPYAPESAEISWTDYNSVTDLINFFQRHDSTLLQYDKDTIMAYGYFRWVRLDDYDCELPFLMSSPNYSSGTAIPLSFPSGGTIHLDTTGIKYITAIIRASRTTGDCYDYSFTLSPLKEYYL